MYSKSSLGKDVVETYFEDIKYAETINKGRQIMATIFNVRLKEV